MKSKMEIRREKIMEMLSLSPVVSIAELAEKLMVSSETIRKDIEYLDEKGLVARIHGGVAPIEKKNEEKSYQLRYNQNIEQKRAIARTACDLIMPGDSIIIESGTTMQELAKCLAEKPDLLRTLMIVTMSFRVAEILTASDYGKIFFLGGWIRKDDYMSYGYHALDMLKDFNVDKTFIGCAGINQNLDVTDYFDDEIMLRRQILKCSNNNIMLADSSKMNRTAVMTVCNLKSLQLIITDKNCSPAMQEKMESAGISYRLV